MNPHPDSPLPRSMTAPNLYAVWYSAIAITARVSVLLGLSQFIQNCEVIGIGDRYQVAWDMPLQPVGMVIAAARYHGRQLTGAVGDTQRLVDDRPPHRR